jgi:hypothetical protein
MVLSQCGGGGDLDGQSARPKGERGRIEPPKGEPRRALDEARLRQQAIGVKLRQIFDQVVNEPVPDDFLDILRRADQKAQKPDED